MSVERRKAEPASSAPYRLVAPRIGYADLTVLANDQVDGMFEAFAATDAIVFDMRGYPNGTGRALERHLTTAHHAVARFSRPMVGEPGEGSFQFVQDAPVGSREAYRGKTITLVDERTLSQAEHVGLRLETANGTRFVGSPSAGANGDVTNLTLPGGLSVMFTGHEVRHADGRQLQQVGLVPDVVARPTLAGLRAGRDEVLEAALRLLAEDRGSPKARP